MNKHLAILLSSCWYLLRVLCTVWLIRLAFLLCSNALFIPTTAGCDLKCYLHNETTDLNSDSTICTWHQYSSAPSTIRVWSFLVKFIKGMMLCLRTVHTCQKGTFNYVYSQVKFFITCMCFNMSVTAKTVLCQKETVIATSTIQNITILVGID